VFIAGRVVRRLLVTAKVLGITSLAGEIYLLTEKERDQVEVYDVITYQIMRRMTVPNNQYLTDIASCEKRKCVYFADAHAECIHKLKVKCVSFTGWEVHDEPSGFSVNAAHNVLVTCRRVRKIKEFSSNGDLLRELAIPDGVANPWHAIQTPYSAEFIVCFGSSFGKIRGVCKISADSPCVVQSHGGKPGSGIGQYSSPRHLAVDDDGSVIVADFENKRVTLLSPTMEYVREIVSRDQFKGNPSRLHLNVQRRQLYVADNKYLNSAVAVFAV